MELFSTLVSKGEVAAPWCGAGAGNVKQKGLTLLCLLLSAIIYQEPLLQLNVRRGRYILLSFFLPVATVNEAMTETYLEY